MSYSKEIGKIAGKPTSGDLIECEYIYKGQTHVALASTKQPHVIVALLGVVGERDEPESLANAEKIKLAWNDKIQMSESRSRAVVAESERDKLLDELRLVEGVWEQTMKDTIGEDGPQSVKIAIEKLKAEKEQYKQKSIELLATLIEVGAILKNPSWEKVLNALNLIENEMKKVGLL